MKIGIRSFTTVLLLTAATLTAQETHFLPGHLAVLRAGDGIVDLKLKQAPLFVDQYDPATFNAAPSFTARIPTNGASSFFFNGHAATEGTLTRSADHKLLAFAGYGGVDLLQVNGTASRIGLQHGICTVDASGTVHSFLYNSDTSNTKMNPRGVATDGTNNFWGCGNAYGTFYFNPITQEDPVHFRAIPNSRAIKIINHTVYASLNAADADVNDQSAGIYSFLPEALPHHVGTPINLAIPAASGYGNVVSFDLDSGGDTAYMADTTAGIQKYVKSNGAWRLACNFPIPQNIPAALNHGTGCFGLTVDFSGPAPIIYATTTEGYGDSVNSNRVVRIVDTGANAAVTTVAQSGSTNIVFRGIEFTPN